MTSQKKIVANRRNAKMSTGPKSERGKEKSSANSLTLVTYAINDFCRTKIFRLTTQYLRSSMRSWPLSDAWRKKWWVNSYPTLGVCAGWIAPNTL